MRWVVMLGFVVFQTSGTVVAQPDMADLIQRCAPRVHPRTMGSIIRQESGGNFLAVSDDGKASLPFSQRQFRSFRPQSKEEAIALAKGLIADGHIVGMGLGQINHRNLPVLGMTIDQMFEPCTNLSASQSVLLGFFNDAMERFQGNESKALVAAISAYNTGNFTAGIRNGYVRSVFANARLPIPNLAISPPAAKGGGNVSYLASRSGTMAWAHGVLTRAPTLLDAKIASVDVENF